MKITESTVRQIEITDVKGLDPIRVMLSDLGPGKGRINIECWGQSWANYWGGMGKETISEFVTTCNEHYIAGKLSGIPASIFDADGLIDTLKREVINDRKTTWILNKKEARTRWNLIDELDLPDNEEQLWAITNQLQEIMGDEWWYRLPKKPNPEYEYLCRIIKTVQSALKECEK